MAHQSMRSDRWGSREGILFICFRISNITEFSCGRDNLENASHVDTNNSYTDKKDPASKISGYVWTGPWARKQC